MHTHSESFGLLGYLQTNKLEAGRGQSTLRASLPFEEITVDLIIITILKFQDGCC